MDREMQNSSELYKQATKFKKEKKYIEAIRLIREAIELDIKNGIIPSIDTRLRIVMYYFYANDLENAKKEIKSLESSSKYFHEFSHIEDTKRKIFQGTVNHKESIISGIKSYLYIYVHCFSDFFTQYNSSLKLVEMGIVTHLEHEERNKRAREFGYKCSLLYFNDQKIDKMIKNIIKKSEYSNTKDIAAIKKFINEKLKLKEEIDFSKLETEILQIL